MSSPKSPKATIPAIYKAYDVERPLTARKLCDNDHMEDYKDSKAKDRNAALKEVFNGLSKEERAEYEKQAAEAKEESLRSLLETVKSAERPDMEASCEMIEAALTKKTRKAGGRKGSKKSSIAKVLGVKPALGSYFLFCSEHRDGVKEDNPDLKAKEVSKVLGTMWRVLSEEEQAVYKMRASEDRKRYEEELEEAMAENPEKVAEAMAAPTKRKHDPSSPKVKRVTGYNVFIKTYVSPDGSKAMMDVKAAAWKALSKEEKEEYKERAAAINEEALSAASTPKSTASTPKSKASTPKSKASTPKSKEETKEEDELDISDDEEETREETREEAEKRVEMLKVVSRAAGKKYKETQNSADKAEFKAKNRAWKKAKAEFDAQFEE
mgnify:CR=1 FL=1